MGGERRERTQNTCQADIDRLIKTVTEIVAAMDFCKEREIPWKTISYV
jgi:hypothetical protein